MKRLLKRFLPRVKWLLLAVAVAQAAQAVLALYLPRITADIIDQGVLVGDTDRIWEIGSWMLGVSVAQMATMICGVFFGARASMAVGREVRKDLFHQITGFSAREVGRFGAPTLITRITNDVQQVQMMVLMTCTTAIVAPVTAVFGTVMAVRQDASLSRVLLVAIPLLGVFLVIQIARMSPVFTAMQDRIDDVNRILREQITGIRVVRAFVREPAEKARFREANEALTDNALTSGRIMALMFPFVIMIQNVAAVAVVWFGAIRIDAGAMSVGSLFAFLGYLVQVLMAVMMATFMFAMLPRAAVAANRIQEALDAESSVVPPARPVVDVAPTGTLELRGAGFRYPGADAPVVSDVSFTVRRGETTAIVGSTGAGKTTLLNLVPRLYDVTDGAVRFDGVDVREIDLEVLWSRIGYVPQKPFLFSGTVASNLRIGKPDATDAELWEALTIAQAADFVSSMPAGLDTPIVQGGTNVSGGQRHRLAIARALIRRPDLYLFDDSFSALDLATDARLRTALVPHTSDAAVVIVAQRISTIVDADQIVVLDGGRVVGLGDHRALLESCSTYREIVESQLGAEEAA